MKHLNRLKFFIPALLAFLPFQAHADITTIRNSDTAIDFAAGANQLRYGENSIGTTLDTEKGWQPDFNIGAGYLLASSNPWLNDLYLRGDINAAFGDTHYNGGLEHFYTNGTLAYITPLESTTRDQIYNFSGKIGHSFPLGGYVMATPFVDIGYHYWHRELTGTGGYTEEYGNGTAMGGAMVQFSPWDKWVFTLSGEAGTTFSPTLQAQYTSFQLQTRTIYEGDAKIGYEFAPRFEVFGTSSFTGYDYGKSPMVDGGYEPASATHDFKALVGIAYHFKEARPAAMSTTSSYNNTYSRTNSSVSSTPAPTPYNAGTAYTSNAAPNENYEVISRSSAKGF
jgi:hypothetical protein